MSNLQIYQTPNKATLADTDAVLMQSTGVGGATGYGLFSLFKSTLATYFASLTETLTNKTLTSPLFSGVIDGWIAAEETWTYVSADAPTFVLSIAADVTSRYTPGMRIKLTQSSTVAYYIVTAVGEYSDGVTPLTLYGGTDYTLADAAISNVYVSRVFAPQGFPLNRTKWDLETIVTSDTTHNPPTQNQWYNDASIVIHIGEWDVYYEVTLFGYKPSANMGLRCTLSTTNNSETDTHFTTRVDGFGNISGTQRKSKHLSITNKITYYLNSKTATADLSNLEMLGLTSPTVIRAQCAYV